MKADLTRTTLIPASELRAGMLVVEWHDDHGRAVFDADPEANRAVEVENDIGLVRVRLQNEDGHRWRSVYTANAQVEIQEDR